MTMDRNSHKLQTRQASIVVIAAMVLWMCVTFIGGKMGLPVRYAFLADLAALAAFAWAGIVLFRVWRARGSGREE